MKILTFLELLLKSDSNLDVCFSIQLKIQNFILKIDFLGTKWHSLRSLPFQGPKKS